MNKKRAEGILNLLKKNYPNAKIILEYENNFELLVAVMLSAQTTDVQVNKVTKNLFPKYREQLQLKEIENFANVNLKTLENDIKSIGLYKNKAKNIKTTSKMLLDRFDGKIPKSLEELIVLPGVGRKTANVVLSVAFGINEGIAVDTHVKKLSLKYSLTKNKTPGKIENDLIKLFEKKDWGLVTILLVTHGRFLRFGGKEFIDVPKKS